jgi:hypothetical protein
MAPLSIARARQLLISSCSVVSRARTSPCCSGKAPDAASEVPGSCSLGWGIPSALARPEVPRPSFSSFWKDRPFGQSLLGYCLKPGCGLVKAAGLHGDVGQLVLGGEAAEVSTLATDERSKVPEVKRVQNAGSAGPQRKTFIECKQSKRVGNFARVKSSEDKRSDACRACLAALRKRRLGRDLDHLQLTVEEAWKRAKICRICNERKEARDFPVDSRTKDGLSSRCRGCKARLDEKSPNRAAEDIPQRCRRCWKVKLACEFYPNRKARNGLDSLCKSCSTLQRAHYRNQCSSVYIQRQTKLCTGCGITKQTSEFSVCRSTIDNLKNVCKKCAVDFERQRVARRHKKRTLEASQPSP